MHDSQRPRPKSLNFFATYLCNSRCVNCGIWQNKEPARPEDELTEKEIENLFCDPLVAGVRDVGFAGGEPTITGFMERAVSVVPQNLQVTITTNALSPARLFNVLATPRSGGWCVQVSMDGLRETNDALRGVSGAYDKALCLLNELRARNISSLISFTINRHNYQEISSMAALAETLGAAFSLRLAHLGGAYKNISRREQFDLTLDELNIVEEEIDRIIEKEIRRPNHNPSRLVFLKNITPYARGQVKDPACFAMDTGLVLDCYGNVFPNCPQMMHAVGNVKEQTLSEVWAGGPANGMRCRIDRLDCGGCWNDCQVPANIELDKDFLLAEYAAMKKDWVRNLGARELNWEDDTAALALIGFHSTEGEPGSKFRWTAQRFSFFIPPETKAFCLTGGPPPDTDSANPLVADVSVDGEPVSRISFEKPEWGTFVVNLARTTQDIAIAEVGFNRVFCPHSEGKGRDCRDLGMALHKINFVR